MIRNCSCFTVRHAVIWLVQSWMMNLVGRGSANCYSPAWSLPASLFPRSLLCCRDHHWCFEAFFLGEGRRKSPNPRRLRRSACDRWPILVLFLLYRGRGPLTFPCLPICGFPASNFEPFLISLLWSTTRLGRSSSAAVSSSGSGWEIMVTEVCVGVAWGDEVGMRLGNDGAVEEPFGCGIGTSVVWGCRVWTLGHRVYLLRRRRSRSNWRCRSVCLHRLFHRLGLRLRACCRRQRPHWNWCFVRKGDRCRCWRRRRQTRQLHRRCGRHLKRLIAIAYATLPRGAPRGAWAGGWA